MPGHYGKIMKKKNGSKKVTGKRKKLDMDKDGKLTKKDFAMLRNKKKKKASALHKKQSKVIEKHIKEMKSYGRAKKGNR